MPVVICPKGHYYNMERYASCPYCAKEEEDQHPTLVRCPKGHLYDPSKYAACPVCWYGEDDRTEPIGEISLPEEEGKWVEDPERCPSCKEGYLEKTDRYCCFCGEKRTGKAAKFWMPSVTALLDVDTVYGPPPVMLPQQCSSCGYEFEISNWRKEPKYCPKCGEPLAGKKHRPVPAGRGWLDEGQWVEDTDHCPNCSKEYLKESDRYCCYCGEKRTGEAAKYWVPLRPPVLYGPMPAMIKHHCSSCHYSFEISNWNAEPEYCPKCGKSLRKTGSDSPSLLSRIREKIFKPRVSSMHREDRFTDIQEVYGPPPAMIRHHCSSCDYSFETSNWDPDPEKCPRCGKPLSEGRITDLLPD